MRGYDDDLEFDDDGEIIERESRLLLPNDALEEEQEDDADEMSDDAESDDPFVFTHRINGPKINQGTIKVRKSLLATDSSLIPFHKSAISQNFDVKKSVESLEPEPRDANTYIYEKIKYKLMVKDAKRKINVEKITLRDLKSLLGEVKTLNDASVQIILALITDSLKASGHWRDEDKDIVMTQAFPLSQSHSDPRYTGFTKELIEYGTFYDSDEVTPQDVEVDNPTSEIRKSGMVVHSLPVGATPMIHNLMRASPDDLYHQVARRMIDTHFFSDFPEHKTLFAACYFYSLGVVEEWHFDVLMRQGLRLQFFTYKFSTYREERVALRKLMRGFIEDYYASNPVVQRALKRHIVHFLVYFYAVTRPCLKMTQSQSV